MSSPSMMISLRVYVLTTVLTTTRASTTVPKTSTTPHQRWAGQRPRRWHHQRPVRRVRRVRRVLM